MISEQLHKDAIRFKEWHDGHVAQAKDCAMFNVSPALQEIAAGHEHAAATIAALLAALSQSAPSPQPTCLWARNGHTPCDAQPAVPVVSDEQIIAIKKASKASDPTKPWGDTLAFARSIIAMSAQAVPMNPDQRKIDQAVHEAVSAIHFADGADYLRALWSVVRWLSPDMARVLDLDGAIAWSISEQITNAYGITAKAEGGA